MLSTFRPFVGSLSINLGLIYLGICTEFCWRASELFNDNLKANLGLGSLTRWAGGFHVSKKCSSPARKSYCEAQGLISPGLQGARTSTGLITVQVTPSRSYSQRSVRTRHWDTTDSVLHASSAYELALRGSMEY